MGLTKTFQYLSDVDVLYEIICNGDYAERVLLEVDVRASLDAAKKTVGR